MRLTKKKIIDILTPILGGDGLPLIEELIGKENISEFDLATKTKKDIKVVRKMLYLLYNNNLVGFTRKKDKQKGWYVYYWTLLPESVRFSYFKARSERLEQIKSELAEENKELFFTCPNKCVRLNFDQGMDFEFHCPECGELISQDSDEKKVPLLKQEISQIEEELKKLLSEQESRRVKAVKSEIRKTAKTRKKGSEKKGRKTIKKKPLKRAIKNIKKKTKSAVKNKAKNKTPIKKAAKKNKREKK